jgi:hypothetical protein
MPQKKVNFEKGNKMRKIYRIVFIIFFAVMLTGFLSILKADAEEGTCVLEASRAGLIRGDP